MDRSRFRAANKVTKAEHKILMAFREYNIRLAKMADKKKKQ